MDITSNAASRPSGQDRRARRALVGAWVGFFVDMFDIYLPVVCLAPAMAYFEPRGVSPTSAMVISGMIFAATLLGRPVGAVVFGYLADTVGRKRSAVLAAVGFGTTTLLIALLPGQETLGVLAIVLLVVLRFVDGLFLGGEYTSATPLALEYSAKSKRGRNGALIMTAFPTAYCFISVLTFALLHVMPTGGVDSAYVQYGWRIPFIFGALLAFGFAFWYSRSVSESAVWQQEGTERSESPLRVLFRRGNRRNFLQVFVLVSGIWLSFNMPAAVLPGQLKSEVGLGDTQVSSALVIAYAILAGAYVCAGLLSQRYGRRRYFMVAGVVTAVAAPVCYGALISGVVTDYPTVVLLTVVVGVLISSSWGVITTYLNERFRTAERASGYGIAYSTAVVLPSFYPFYQAGLASFMPLAYTPLVLIVVGGALIFGGALAGPETRDVDMADDNAVDVEGRPVP